MTISVEIADRMFDYTDEEKAAEAVAEFQVERGLDDDTVIALWDRPTDAMRSDLEKRIFDAVDRNGTARRAAETVPAGLMLYVDASDAAQSV